MRYFIRQNYFQVYQILICRSKYILGKIIPIFEERLRGVGGWLDINGEAIFGSTYWIYQNDSMIGNNVWYTTSKSDASSLYAIILEWPKDGKNLKLRDIITTEDTDISLLGHDGGPLRYRQYSEHLTIQFPSLYDYLRQCGKYCQWGFVLKITHFQPRKDVEVQIIL